MKNLERYFVGFQEYKQDYQKYRRYVIAVKVPYKDIPEYLWNHDENYSNKKVLDWLCEGDDSGTEK